jgi:hypothetical protein
VKRTCIGCRALEYDLKPELGFKCSLGFKFQKGQIFRPLENCPKPRTISEFCKELEK